MAAVLELPFALGAAPASFKAAAPAAISQPSTSTLFPAGTSYLAHTRRQLHQRTFEQDDEAEHARLQAELANAGTEDEGDLGIGDEPESAELLARDPKEWKSQDHYAVLGLSALRWRATPEQIKLAHRRKVLKHHPDKKVGASGMADDDSFFKCIAKAHDVLSNPEKRRQFDSVDEAIDDEDVPSGKEKPEAFYKLWAPVFEREARFSEAKNGPVPSLGDENTPKQQVNEFYDFWYNFDSWRSFEYLDKEVNEGSEARDDKRYTEKKNKSERARRKKEDNTRLRSLVDKALATDPRIKKFKAEEKAAREAKKKGRPGQAGGAALTPAQLAEQKKAKEEAERQAKEAEAKQAEVDKAAKADAKKAKEAAKKNLKKEKKRLRDIITGANYFLPAGTAPDASVIEAQLNGLDALVGALEPEEVAALREACEKAGADGAKAELNKAATGKGVAAGAFA